MCFYPIITFDDPFQQPYYSCIPLVCSKGQLPPCITQWVFLRKVGGGMAEGQVRGEAREPSSKNGRGMSDIADLQRTVEAAKQARVDSLRQKQGSI